MILRYLWIEYKDTHYLILNTAKVDLFKLRSEILDFEKLYFCTFYPSGSLHDQSNDGESHVNYQWSLLRKIWEVDCMLKKNLVDLFKFLCDISHFKNEYFLSFHPSGSIPDQSNDGKPHSKHHWSLLRQIWWLMMHI